MVPPEDAQVCGSAYDPCSVNATGEGECAVLCPASPHPGKNLPLNFSDISEDKQYRALYIIKSYSDRYFQLDSCAVCGD